ncbi:MAG: LptA/OstA family protein [Coraliomargaritaceae bacterium]
MQPKAPIQNFRIPRFADNGYTQWVLRGERGLYRDAERVAVDGMELRIYSADERKLVELSMESALAEILIEENWAYSEAPIEITGGNFTLDGVGWNWQGDEKSIEVQSQAKVVFAEGSGASLGPLAMIEGNTPDTTTISSDRLLLSISESAYCFEFTGNVNVLSGDGTLRSHTLTALANLPEAGSKEVPQSLHAEGVESMQSIVATESVIIRQDDRVIRTERLVSYPREDRAELSGLTEVSLPGALISGGRIETSPGKAKISALESGARAQMILLDTGELGVGGDSQLSEETIILSDSITMQEEADLFCFLFEGRVDVLSGALRQRSDKLTVHSRKVESESESGGHEEVGQVHRLLAEGNVVIERTGQVARADTVLYRPLQETAELKGSPEFSDGDSTLRGRRIDLAPGRVIVHGSEPSPVLVQLPELSDLAYAGPSIETANTATGEPTEDVEITEGVVPEPTIVQSREVIIYHGGDSQRIDFKQDVEVNGTNLRVRSQKMEVYLVDPDGSSNASGSFSGEVKRIIARDEVEIVQGERTATCESAELLPEDGLVVLTGRARVVDPDGMAEGHRIILDREQRRARVEGGSGEGDGRARITLPDLKDKNQDTKD